MKVLDAVLLYRLWVRQDGFTHDVDGTHVSELPVSKQPVNCFGGLPSWNTPKYCTHKREKFSKQRTAAEHHAHDACLQAGGDHFH